VSFSMRCIILLSRESSLRCFRGLRDVCTLQALRQMARSFLCCCCRGFSAAWDLFGHAEELFNQLNSSCPSQR